MAPCAPSVLFGRSLPSTHLPSRLRRAVEDLKLDIADPSRGANEEQVRQAIVDAIPEGEIPPNSFVAHIIANNQSNYDAMLNNQFCKDMAAASTEEEKEKVLKGYKWYMVDFMYCENLVRYDAGRASNAPTTQDVLAGAKHVQDSYDFAQTVLKTCTNDLKIPKDTVLATKKSSAVTDYGAFEVDTAQDQDWFTSKIAMIPCIQGYYQIAKMLEKTSKDKDTVWYKTWVLENINWSYCESQIKFFEANKPELITPGMEETWNRVFRTACGHEVDFFALGENPQDI